MINYKALNKIKNLYHSKLSKKAIINLPRIKARGFFRDIETGKEFKQDVFLNDIKQVIFVLPQGKAFAGYYTTLRKVK